MIVSFKKLYLSKNKIRNMRIFVLLFAILFNNLLAENSWKNIEQKFENIIHGTPVKNNTQYPFMVFLYRHILNTLTKYPICSGTIISDQWILTSAQCLMGRVISGQAVAGTISRNSYSLKDVRRIIETKAHPDFDRSISAHNIGLIKVSHKYVWSNTINPVRLITSDASLLNKIPATILGWGHTETGTPSVILNKLNVQIVVADECIGEKYIICSLNNEGGPCISDSGGPLLLLDSIQAGIVSHGPRTCGFPNTTSKYTFVAYYREWIKSIAGI